MDEVFPELESNEPVAELVALAEALRGLTEEMLRVPQLDAALRDEADALKARVEAYTERLRPFAPGDATPRMGPTPESTRPYYVRGVMMGPHHPLRPEVELAHEDGVTRGRVHFGVTFEGPPGCVHGGFVAHFFDQILGQHNLFARIPAMTGTLSVRYRRGTPILRELAFEVRHESDGERKVRTFGALSADGEVVSEGEGLFVIPRSAEWSR